MVKPFVSVDVYNIEIKKFHELLRRSVADFANEYLEPRWKEVESKDIIPEDIYKMMVDLGFFGIGIPEKYGGQGGDQISKMIVIEELSKVIPSIGVILDTTDFPILSLLLWGSEEKKREILPDIAGGAAGAAALTEPHAGSWLAGIKTRAVKSGTNYIINGKKIFISTLDYAKYIIVLAKTSESKEDPYKGMSLFLVERDMPGVKIGTKINTLSMKGDRPYEIIFEDAKIPESYLIGEEGMGFYYTMILLNFTRINIAAQATGIAQGAFERTLKYSLEREAFGKRIYSFQGVSFKISNMFMRIQASRLLTYWAANLSENQFKSPSKPLIDIAIAGSAAKTYATETAEYCSRQAVQVHGGIGVDMEVGIERYLRDAIVTTIYEGTNEIQRYIIARFLPKLIYNIDIKM
jgi:alkylation response protein AidB-like acyl-CoA dehydrogenase